MNRLAVFDCDGTLLDSQAMICAAMEQCFAELALPSPGEAATRRIVGLSLPQAMAALLPEAGPDLHDRLTDAYKRAFHAMRLRGEIHEPLFAGIADAVDVLEAEGWLLGIATGKSDRGLRHALEAHGLAGRFVTLQTADRHPSKPSPAMLEAAMAEAGAAPATTTMIGDTSYDMAMARAAGAYAIGVGWGYHPHQELFAAGADAVADSPADIVRLIRDRA